MDQHYSDNVCKMLLRAQIPILTVQRNEGSTHILAFPSIAGFISSFYTLKVQSHGFTLQSWSFSAAHFGRGEPGGCLVFELFEEPSAAFTLQLSTSCSVEISPHIGPLCTFTSTQPHSTPLNFILRRGPLIRPRCSFCQCAAANKDSCLRLG